MKKILLLGIILLAAFVRLINITGFPSGLNADEASLGYNAYSLILTGKDEHGHPWPVNLESFGDFKPAGYTYLLIPFIKVLGLNELAVRLPAALIGVLGVALIFFLVRDLNVLDSESKNTQAGLIASLLLTISPWHIHFSRGAWEVNVASTLIIAGLWFLISWHRGHSLKFLLLSAFMAILSMYTYQSARILSPVIFLFTLVYLEKVNILRYVKSYLIVLMLTATLLIPLFVSLVQTDASSRFSGVGLLSDQGPINRVNELRGQYSSNNMIIGRLLHNRVTAYTYQFVSNYLDHFGGDFLFVNGDKIERNKIPESGQMYLIDIFGVVIGMYFVIKSRNSTSKLILIWLLLAPIAAALTFQTPHALRAEFMVYPLIILSSVGITSLVSLEWSRKIKYVIVVAISLVYIWSFARFTHEYFVHYSKTYPEAWQYGFDQIVNYVSPRISQYDHIYITDKYDQPYILFLFYLKYPPQMFQGHHSLTVRDKFNFSTVKEFDKFVFTNTSWDNLRDNHDSLIVAAADDIPEVGVNIVHTIYSPGGSPLFKFVSN